MNDDSERRRHYQNEENIPLSESIREAVRAHEHSEAGVDEAALYDHIDIQAIDRLVPESDDVDISVQLYLPNVTVSIWSNDAVDIRVTDEVP